MKISEKFKNLIPPLTSEEFNQLEQNCIKDGILESIKTWQGTIIDGHNRYNIAVKNGLSFETKEINFNNESEVVEWIILLQLGRRNLTESQKSYLRGVRYENEKLKSGLRTDLVQNLPKVDTAQKLANEYNVSERTIKNDANFSKGIDLIASVEPEKRFEILQETSELTKQEIQEFAKIPKQAENEIKKNVIIASEEEINKQIEIKANELVKAKLQTIEAQKEAKKVERKNYIEAQKQAINSGEVKLPEGKFEVVVIDPPWNYGREYDPENSRVANPYPEMSQEQLLELEIPSADNSVIYLWTTHKFLFDAKELLDNWGFDYKATLVWNKEKMGMGAWFRMQCEFCLVGIKGKPLWNNTKWRDVITEPRREHSRKPEIFYEMINEINAGRKLDYFSRSNREGWSVYGNDTQKF
jgi:N6-adenosine-specific RNA methylase IME4/DNA-binding protein H-NS